MQALPLTAASLLTDPNKLLYTIPAYQREYEWGTSIDGDPQVVDFWQDIWDKCWTDRSHFVGFILCTQGMDGTDPCWQIVDGQQRMTTLFLLAVAVRDFCTEKGQPDLITPWLLKDATVRLRLTERFGSNSTVLNALVQRYDKVLAGIEQDNRLVAAYRLFKTRLSTHFDSTPAECHRFFEKALNNLRLMFIIIDPKEGDDAATIFETLNARGRPVEEVEKIRNLIILSCQASPELSVLSEQIWKNLESVLDEQDLPKFLEVYGQRDGYQSIRRTAYDEIKCDILEASKPGVGLAAWLKSFEQAVTYYDQMISAPEKCGQAYGLLRLTFPELHPLILRMAMDVGWNSILFQALESTVVRMVCQLDRPTIRLVQMAEKACAMPVGPTWPAALLALLKDGYAVNDADFLTCFSSKRFYGPGVQRKRLFYIFERIENFDRKASSSVVLNDQKATIEHIMPQTLSDAWKTELEEADPDLTKAQMQTLFDKRLHTLGNLTILMGDEQGKSSNKPYSEKRDIYTATPAGKNLTLNDYFTSRKIWGIRQIETRSKKLAEIANKIWTKL